MSRVWTPEQIENFEKKYEVKCTLRPDGMYDVVGDIYLHTNNAKSLLDVLPPILNLYGGLKCQRNRLKDLKGSPRYITLGFDCEYNSLKTLEGAPLYVGMYFDCQNNPNLRFIRQELDAMNIQSHAWWDPDQLIYVDPCEFVERIPV